MKLSVPSGLSSLELLALWEARRFNFYDEFNRGAVDADYWAETLDGGGTLILVPGTADQATCYRLTTGNVIDNDAGITGLAIKNKGFTPFEEGYTTVTMTARTALPTITDISALMGLFDIPPTGYAEPVSDCSHFLMDPAVTNTFRTRTWAGGEEEGDTLVALDTDFHILSIIWTRTSVTFYIDGVNVGSHGTQVPDENAYLGLLIRTEAAAVRQVEIDYVHVELS